MRARTGPGARWSTIVGGLFPRALLSHRSALEFRPTDDGEIFLQGFECLGACDFAPAVLAGSVLYKNVTKEKIDEIIAALE